MRLWVQIGEEVIDRPDVAVVAVREFVEGRVFHFEIGVPYAAAHVDDCVARHAAEARLGFGSIDLLANGLIETAVKEDCVVMTSGAPLAGARARDVLHILDGFPIELIVERGKVVHGALPLVVDVFVALAAGFGIHEEIGRDDFSGVGLGGGWGEGRTGSRAFFLHRDGYDGGILDGRRGGARIEGGNQDGRAGQDEGNSDPIASPRDQYECQQR